MWVKSTSHSRQIKKSGRKGLTFLPIHALRFFIRNEDANPDKYMTRGMYAMLVCDMWKREKFCEENWATVTRKAYQYRLRPPKDDLWSDHELFLGGRFLQEDFVLRVKKNVWFFISSSGNLIPRVGVEPGKNTFRETGSCMHWRGTKKNYSPAAKEIDWVSGGKDLPRNRGKERFKSMYWAKKKHLCIGDHQKGEENQKIRLPRRRRKIY